MVNTIDRFHPLECFERYLWCRPIRSFSTLTEERRLDSLGRTGNLETFPESDYDEITDLVSQSLEVSAFPVSFVGTHRLWFKECNNMDVMSLFRYPFFCHHAIQGDEAFMFPGAPEDDRFKQ